MLDTERGLRVLQSAARDGTNPQLLLAIARVQFSRDDFPAATEICLKLMQEPLPPAQVRAIVKLGLRSALFGAESLRWHGQLSGAVELLDSAADLVHAASVAEIDLDSADWLVRLKVVADELKAEFDDDHYLANRCGDLASKFLDRVRVIDRSALNRSTGQVRKVDLEKHFAFAESHGQDHFFHHNDLVNREDWDSVAENVLVCFTPEQGAQGPRARRVRVL